MGFAKSCLLTILFSVCQNFTIEMTLRGVLLAGGWRNAAELNNMLLEDKRNTLIVVMDQNSNQDVGYFQGFNNDDLIGKGAVIAFLKAAQLRTPSQLKTMSDDDQRNTLIVQNNKYSDITISQLQGYNNKELVQIGLQWFSNSKTVAAILELIWDINSATVLQQPPFIIATQSYDNSGSSVPLTSKFTVSRQIEEKSTFSHEHGFTVGVGVETTFKAGIPLLAENEVTVKLDVSTSHTWNFGEENTVTQTYTHESDVMVPPFKKLKKIAQVSEATLDVPYQAKIRAGDGSIHNIRGTWQGVSTVNLVVKQEDIL